VLQALLALQPGPPHGCGAIVPAPAVRAAHGAPRRPAPRRPCVCSTGCVRPRARPTTHAGAAPSPRSPGRSGRRSGGRPRPPSPPCSSPRSRPWPAAPRRALGLALCRGPSVPRGLPETGRALQPARASPGSAGSSRPAPWKSARPAGPTPQRRRPGAPSSSSRVGPAPQPAGSPPTGAPPQRACGGWARGPRARHWLASSCRASCRSSPASLPLSLVPRTPMGSRPAGRLWAVAGPLRRPPGGKVSWGGARGRPRAHRRARSRASPTTWRTVWRSRPCPRASLPWAPAHRPRVMARPPRMPDRRGRGGQQCPRRRAAGRGARRMLCSPPSPGSTMVPMAIPRTRGAASGRGPPSRVCRPAPAAGTARPIAGARAAAHAGVPPGPGAAGAP
jgi:hypothetical protein